MSELMGGGSPRHLNTLSNWFTVAVHHTRINTCYVLLLLLTGPMYSMFPLQMNQNIRTYTAYIIAILTAPM